MVGVYITFNGVQYVGYEDSDCVIEVQDIIRREVNEKSRYYLKNTKDGDIMFPVNALFESEVKLVEVKGE